MLLRLKVIEGKRKNEEFSVKADIKIGRSRSETDLTLNDSKASGVHSRIFIKDNKFYYIEDLGSSNGTYLNSEKLTSPKELSLGDIVGIGRTLLEVIQLELGESGFERNTWQYRVDKALTETRELYEKQSPPNPDFGYFKTPVSLEIIKGVGTGTQFVFSFGPRSIGLFSPDAPVLIRGFPERAFDLTPKNEACVLKTGLTELKVNSKLTTEAILKDGDIISVGQTEFIVKFIATL